MIENLDVALDKEMDDIIDEIFSISQENIIKNGSFDTGFMMRSGNVQRKFLEKIIVYPAPYSSDIEWGTDPHPVDPEVLLKWVNRKLGIRGKEAVRVSYAIANKISRFGTNPQPFVRPAIKTVEEKHK